MACWNNSSPILIRTPMSQVRRRANHDLLVFGRRARIDMTSTIRSGTKKQRPFNSRQPRIVQLNATVLIVFGMLVPTSMLNSILPMTFAGSFFKRVAARTCAFPAVSNLDCLAGSSALRKFLSAATAQGRNLDGSVLVVRYRLQPRRISSYVNYSNRHILLSLLWGARKKAPSSCRASFARQRPNRIERAWFFDHALNHSVEQQQRRRVFRVLDAPVTKDAGRLGKVLLLEFRQRLLVFDLGLGPVRLVAGH